VALAVHLFGEFMDDQIQVLVRLLDALRSAGVRHALAGGHAVSAHTRPRMTIDVDLLIDARRRTTVERSLHEAGFTLRTEKDVLHVLSDPEATVVADLLSDSHPVWAEALRTAVNGHYQGQRLPVVTPASLIAMKYLAATSPSRPQEERLIDVSDISRLAKAHWSEEEAQEALRIVELAFRGAGRALERLVGDLLANRPVTI
jgi:hypothetical protein